MKKVSGMPKAIRARKNYKCRVCGGTIRKGDYYEEYEHFSQTYRGLRRLVSKRHVKCPAGTAGRLTKKETKNE